MDASNADILVQNTTEKAGQGIDSSRSKAQSSLAKLKARTEGKPWKTSLWACCVPADLCLVTTFCMCVTFGKTSHRVENDGDMTTYRAINPPCAVFACFYCWVSPLYQAVNLYRMRQKYSIEGSITEDVLKAGCCLCCSIMQAEKESRLLLGDKRTGLDGVVEEQYTGPAEKMIMASQALADLNVQPTTLHRISEETFTVEATQGDTSDADTAAAFDDTSVATTVVEGQCTKQVSATTQTDNITMSTTVASAEDTEATTDSARESAVTHAGRTKASITSGQPT